MSRIASLESPVKSSRDILSTLKKATDVMKKALDDHLNRIVLVGGSSNMPQISRAIAERIGYDPKDILMHEPQGHRQGRRSVR